MSATTLPTRPLGDSGLTVPVVGLGCNNFGWRIDRAATRAVVDAALADGVTFFDTADIYGGGGTSETFLGEVLGRRRDEIVLATKFGMDMNDGAAEPRGSAAYIRRAIDGSLRRLQTDHVDLYWYHQPDGTTPILETLGALHELVQAGKVRAIGASNVDARQIEDADRLAREHGLTRFCAVQNEYSLLRRAAEQAELPACERLGIGFVPYFPLASGLLTGKYSRGAAGPDGARLSGRGEIASEADFRVIEAVAAFAAERGLTVIEVAIGGLLAQPAVSSVIAGATRAEQVAANATGGRWSPSADDLRELRAALDQSSR